MANTFPTSGNAGIGTTTPGSPLEIAGKGSATLSGGVTNDWSGGYIISTPGGSNTGYMQIDPVGNLYFAHAIPQGYVFNGMAPGTAGFSQYTAPNGPGGGTLVINGKLLSGGYVTPEMYGADGTGSTACDSAFAAAMNSGQPILITGTYKLVTSIAVSLATGVGLTIKGTGSAKILLASATAGLKVTVSAPGVPVGAAGKIVLQDFTFVPSVTNGTAYALEIDAGAASGSFMPTLNISNIDVIPALASGGNWCGGGFLLKDVRQSQINNCSIFGVKGIYYGFSGSTPGAINSLYNGIVFASTVSGSQPTTFRITGCQFCELNCGVLISPLSPVSGISDPQGVYVINCDFVGCLYGVHAASLDLTSDGITICDNDVTYGLAGVYLSNWQRPIIHDNYFLAGFMPSAPPPNDGSTNPCPLSVGIDIEMPGGKTVLGIIHDNIFNFQEVTSSAAGGTNHYYSQRIAIKATTSGFLGVNVHDNISILATAAYDPNLSNITTVASANYAGNYGTASTLTPSLSGYSIIGNNIIDGSSAP